MAGVTLRCVLACSWNFERAVVEATFAGYISGCASGDAAVLSRHLSFLSFGVTVTSVSVHGMVGALRS